MIFPLLLTLEEEKFLNLSKHVLPFLSPVRIDLSSLANGVVKKTYGRLWISMYLSNKTVNLCVCGGEGMASASPSS